jgi:hypothetical protein
VIETTKPGSDAHELATHLRKKIAALLAHYESVLSAHDVKLPYFDTVGT